MGVSRITRVVKAEVMAVSDLCQFGNVVPGVYRPVLAKRVPVIGSTPEQRCDREQESQRKKEHCSVEIGWSTPDECRGPEETFRSGQAAKQRWEKAEKQSAGSVDREIEMPVRVAKPRRKGSQSL